MAQKIHPTGFRVGIGIGWQSRWFASKQKYKVFVLEDLKIREYLFKKLKPAGIASVEVERSINKLKVVIFVARPGVLIGRGGVGLTELKKQLMKHLGMKDESALEIAPREVKSADLSAYLVAQSVAEQLIKRLPAARVINQTLERVMRAGAKGVKVELAGRIGGSEIARREWKRLGMLPLHTLRADIDYSMYPALTKSGYIGVKVWINKGEIAL